MLNQLNTVILCRVSEGVHIMAGVKQLANKHLLLSWWPFVACCIQPSSERGQNNTTRAILSKSLKWQYGAASRCQTIINPELGALKARNRIEDRGEKHHKTGETAHKKTEAHL